MKLYTRKELSSYNTSLTYNDIGLVPMVISDILSRKNISTETIFLDRKIDIPVISSPMDTVTGNEMSHFLKLENCMGIPFKSKNDYGYCPSQRILTVNAKFKNYPLITESMVDIICIDTANASNKYVIGFASELKQRYPNMKIIVGNIIHPYVLLELEKNGIDAVRIGIGSGSMCSTSIQTGIGIGQVTAISNCVEYKKEKGLKIELIADGGIKTVGDICKALALGADVVMVGRMFAGTEESPGEVIKHNGKKYKIYRGSASYSVKMDKEFIEGEETLIEYKGSVRKSINEIKDGLRSCLSYLGMNNVIDVKKENVYFSILSVNSYLERLPKL